MLAGLYWLVKYKFKNWKRTKRRRQRVTKKRKVEVARKIADDLNNVEKWHSHSKGITMAILQKQLKLEIDDYGAKGNEKLREKIKNYYDLISNYMGTRGHDIAFNYYERYFGLSLR